MANAGAKKAAPKPASKVKGKAKPKVDAVPLEATRHKSRPVNIPTEVLKVFVLDEHRRSQTKQCPRRLCDRFTDGTIYRPDYLAPDPQLA